MPSSSKPKFKLPLREYAGLLAQYLIPQWPAMTALALLLLSGITMQLISPQLIRFFLDTAQSGHGGERLMQAALWFIGLSLLTQIVRVIAAYIGENVGWTATNRLRSEVAAHCLKLDMSFHKKHTSGSIIERVDGDINALGNFFSNFVILLVSNMVLMAGILILLFRENILIGAVMTVFVVFALVVIQRIRRYAAPMWSKMRQISAEFYGFLGEHLEGTEDTRANGATAYVMHRFHSLLRTWLPIRIRAFFGFAAMWITAIVVFALGNAMAFGISAYLWRQGSITIGAVYMVFHYTELLAQPIEKIRQQLEDLQKADASITRIRELLATQSLIRDGGNPFKLPEGPLSVEFRNVTFGYEEDSATLKGLNFRLEPGKVLGLLGRTGSGKSTTARLLLRFYDPGEGAILLGGTDIREVRLHDLRSRIGFVTQNIEIFQGTVRDNLTFYDSAIADSLIRQVLEELGLGNWLAALPQGLDTLLESGGGGLSAGEAQLLAFARVFLKNPGLVVLDEASSRLDPATEQLLERAVSKLLKDRTCIIIAHRLSTIQRADDILMLDDGRIAEHGRRLALLADPGSRFSRVMEAGLEEVLA
ncbi:ABC transporter ATP-binding protein [Paenibacillus sp. YN15]|uniref:ABC transporter ATP-binding protein n=1 Tax=Paenibacillus sp. YN15 TaxID=1742774 RepID=UPI000DCBC50F|nr:ABC transporter ATP-binding protein [Paenibacillus sp. YN15]RAU96519.1 ABC transporter ATP-binding protein [Paenibacillus sp. YN15]